MADKIKLLITVLLLLAGLAGFYIFADQSLLFRVLGLLVAVVLALVVASKTEMGAGALGYMRGATVEARKVVWPSRKETMQTTLMVLAMVVLVGIILWMFDMFLAWAVQLLTGQGG